MATQILNPLFTEHNRPDDVRRNVMQVLIVSCILTVAGLFAIYCTQLALDDNSVLTLYRKVVGMIGMAVLEILNNHLMGQIANIITEIINEFLVIS